MYPILNPCAAPCMAAAASGGRETSQTLLSLDRRAASGGRAGCVAVNMPRKVASDRYKPPPPPTSTDAMGLAAGSAGAAAPVRAVHRRRHLPLSRAAGANMRRLTQLFFCKCLVAIKLLLFCVFLGNMWAMTRLYSLRS